MRIESPGRLLLGLATGTAFGVLLQKGRVAKYEVITRQLLLRDFTVVKIMGTAMAVGAVGFHALKRRGRASLRVQPLRPVGVGLGAALFGLGLAALGYCPGTTVAAVGEGRRDAVAGVLGMLAGAAAYVVAYPRIKPFLDAGNRGKLTLPAATRTPDWPWVAGLAGAVVVAAGAMEAGARPTPPRTGRVA